MEAATLFPVLMAFMLAVLSALGYALYRLSDTLRGLDAPAIPCAQCGEPVLGGANQCPSCGAWRQISSAAAYAAPTGTAGIGSQDGTN